MDGEKEEVVKEGRNSQQRKEGIVKEGQKEGRGQTDRGSPCLRHRRVRVGTQLTIFQYGKKISQ
jgi:hypothetical protein